MPQTRAALAVVSAPHHHGSQVLIPAPLHHGFYSSPCLILATALHGGEFYHLVTSRETSKWNPEPGITGQNHLIWRTGGEEGKR